MRKQKNLQWEAKLRCQHRRISLFALIQCWLKEVDGLVLTHSDLAAILQLTRIEETHIDQLVDNMREFFPFCVPIWSPRPKTLRACFVSRRPIRTILGKQGSSIPKQIEALKQEGIPFETFTIWTRDQSRTPLTALKTHLDALAQGDIANIPPMEKRVPLVFKKQ